MREGEIFGILGPNGAGKTTIVECIEGLRTPDSGDISVLGLNPKRDRAESTQLIEGVRGRGVTIVLVTHFMEEAERLCDRVALIGAGPTCCTFTPCLESATAPPRSPKPSTADC